MIRRLAVTAISRSLRRTGRRHCEGSLCAGSYCDFKKLEAVLNRFSLLNLLCLAVTAISRSLRRMGVNPYGNAYDLLAVTAISRSLRRKQMKEAGMVLDKDWQLLRFQEA